MTPTIELAGITFGDGSLIDANGIRWVWQELVGWFTSNVRFSTGLPAGADGEVLLEARRGAKPLTLTGFAGVEDLETWWTAANVFEQAFEPLMNYDTPGTITVNEPGGAKSLEVWVPGPTQLSRVGVWEEISDGEVCTGFQFVIPLLATDPDKT